MKMSLGNDPTWRSAIPTKLSYFYYFLHWVSFSYVGMIAVVKSKTFLGFLFRICCEPCLSALFTMATSYGMFFSLEAKTRTLIDRSKQFLVRTEVRT